MATTQYPTYQSGVSNRLQQGANRQATGPKVGPTYSQPTDQYTSNMGMQRNPYGSDYGRGGANPTRPTNMYQPDPLPGSTITRDQQSYYNPTYPQYNPQGQGQQANPNQFSYYQGLDPTTLQSNDEREAALQAVQANVPIWQLGQNAYQYSQDFNEAQRRWNEQFNYQQGLDQYNMQLSGRQQTMAEWQAQQAANQWAQDYNRQSANDKWQQQFSQQQFGLQDYATREQLNQAAQAQAWQQQYQGGQLQQGNRQLDIQQQQNEINRAYNEGRLSNEARQIALSELAQSQNYGLAQKSQQIDELYKTGQLSLGQRNAALAELTQQQTYGLQMAQLNQSQQEQARRFSLDFDTQRALEAYRQQELMQQRELAQAQLAQQREAALIAATGRNQPANVRWMRST